MKKQSSLPPRTNPVSVVNNLPGNSKAYIQTCIWLPRWLELGISGQTGGEGPPHASPSSADSTWHVLLQGQRGTSANTPGLPRAPASAHVLLTYIPLAEASPTMRVWVRHCKQGTDPSKVGSRAMGSTRHWGPRHASLIHTGHSATSVQTSGLNLP